MSFPAVTDLGEEVKIIEKHALDAGEVFVEESGRLFTRNLVGDVHQLIELVTDEEKAVFGDVAAKASELVAKETPAVREIIEDTKDAFLNGADHAGSPELSQAALVEDGDPTAAQAPAVEDAPAA